MGQCGLCLPPVLMLAFLFHGREGHMSLIQEIKAQMDSKPGALVLSVGGGGMLCGVIRGLREVGWDDVPIVASETEGAHSLHAALAAGKLVTLPKITR